MTARLLTCREVADLVGVNPETVLRWTRRGELAAVRLPGGQLRYRPDELEAWLAANTTGAGVEESPDTPSRARRARAYPLRFESPDTRPPT